MSMFRLRWYVGLSVTTSIAHRLTAETKGTNRLREGLLVVAVTLFSPLTESENGVVRIREDKPHSIKGTGEIKMATSKVCLPQSPKIPV